MDELITVITLTYYSTHIYETIDSVLSQTYSNIQYIISDDGSEGFDKSAIEKYISKNKKANIVSYTVLAGEVNVGTVKNMNRAIDISEGKYIVPLSGDDIFYDSTTLYKWANEFKKTNAEIITAKREVYDEGMTKLVEICPKKQQINNIVNLSPRELFEKLTVSNFIFGASTARTRESFLKYGKYDETYRLIEDYPMILKLLRNNVKIHFMDCAVIKYRLGGISSTHKINRDYFKEQDLIFEKEVMPYCLKPEYSRKLYEKWKHEIISSHNYRYNMDMNRDNKLIQLFYSVIYIISNPKKRIENMLLRLQNN